MLWLHVGEWAGAALLMLPIVLGLATIAGRRLAQQALLPITDIADRANRIRPIICTNACPSRRATQSSRTSRAWSTGCSRAWRRRSIGSVGFTSDASHELRTPLAAMRSVGEVGLERERSAAEYGNVIGSMLEEVNRLTALVDALLVVARPGDDRPTLKRTIVPVSELVKEATGLLDVLVEEKKQKLVVRVEEFRVDQRRSRPAAPGARQPRSQRHRVLARVEHHPSADRGRRARTYRRPGRRRWPGHSGGASRAGREIDLYRVEDARSRDGGGAGLGLSIAKWAVEVHGGSLTLNGARDQGAMFEVSLPSIQSGSPGCFQPLTWE